MAVKLKGHMTRHPGAHQLSNLKNLHTICTKAAVTNAADTPAPDDCCVNALLAEEAAGPNRKEIMSLPPELRPALTQAPSPRVIYKDKATPLKSQ